MPKRRKGSKFWQITVKGVRQSSETTDFKEAEALEHRLNHEEWLNDKMGLKPPRSWADACVKWCEEKAGKSSINDDIKKIRWLDPHLGHITDLNKISRELVDGILQKRPGVNVKEKTPANNTANHFVVLIGGILNSAERVWNWGNRAPSLRTYPIDRNGVGKTLTPEQWQKLVPHLNPITRLTATFALATGLREGKVFALEWSQIDMAERSLTFEGTDNKLGNTIPLNDTAMGVLQEIRSGPVVHAQKVFVYAGEAWSDGVNGKAGGVKVLSLMPLAEHDHRTWKRGLERAGIDYVRWHDLRHTFNSWLAQRGVPQDIRKRLMGHATTEVHDRYTHLFVNHLRQYSAVIDSVLGNNVVEIKKVG